MPKQELVRTDDEEDDHEVVKSHRRGAKARAKTLLQTQEQGVDLAALELEYTLALQMPIIDKLDSTS